MVQHVPFCAARHGNQVAARMQTFTGHSEEHGLNCGPRLLDECTYNSLQSWQRREPRSLEHLMSAPQPHAHCERRTCRVCRCQSASKTPQTLHRHLSAAAATAGQNDAATPSSRTNRSPRTLRGNREKDCGWRLWWYASSFHAAPESGGRQPQHPSRSEPPLSVCPAPSHTGSTLVDTPVSSLHTTF